MKARVGGRLEKMRLWQAMQARVTVEYSSEADNWCKRGIGRWWGHRQMGKRAQTKAVQRRQAKGSNTLDVVGRAKTTAMRANAELWGQRR